MSPASNFEWVLIVVLLSVAAQACKPSDTLPVEEPSESSGAAVAPAPWQGEVAVHGALRAMFHEGQTGSQVSLDTLLPNPRLYAVGALAGLAGEVTVIGGETYLSYPEGERETRAEKTAQSDAGAALLVSAEVGAWRDVAVQRDIPFSALDEEIATLAAAAGTDPGRRFPFLLEGEVEDLRWHVIDGSRLTEGGSSHHDHLAASVQQTREKAQATLLGFYSASDQGVFTHMDSKTHIHCVLADPLTTGHVDNVTIPAGTVIMFPVAQQVP